jgi:antitoxin (DNA-binding transcriptional repressor) of toxin-antitoxin stability system
MNTISVDEIHRDPDGFLQRVEAGEPLLVMRGVLALAEVKPLRAPSSELRPYGLSIGGFTIPADFDEPLPDEVLSDFEGR